ncbi:hypothetical protein [Amycolatopsis eburnea]|uniref:Uncharacterized protein n=1 Tax=Amycolatopsis eburnea TaxID=2267691 RepID=A0A427TQ05_9PSEU|nr:hypothetical protein [Amycolatopsis eburnea]RSD26337.1 hypothetical protein EIY87_00290 [Amycolatopsis eburnea]
MTEQPTTPEVTEMELVDMRETLVNAGIQGAATAPSDKVIARIETFWPGGVAGYRRDQYGK